MSCIPDAMLRILRDPAPAEADFAPTRFCPASSKAWFAVHYTRFVSSDFPKHQFTNRFYQQLMHTFGHVAHFDLDGFWTEFFTGAAGKVEFLAQTVAWPCPGSPGHTWCDVEREIVRRLRQADLLGYYRARLGAERDAAERAEFARLRAKFEGTRQAVHLDVPRAAVMAPDLPQNHRAGSRAAAAGQLTLGLG